jgi:uncharacterized protein YecE (DUF72 family)
MQRAPGRLYAGTSGFSYAAWAPRFYPAGTRPAGMLARYAARLPAVELNNTFYRQPRPEVIVGWLAATPAHFRFVVKAQRGAASRAFGVAGSSSHALAESVGWLTAPYRLFGERLGCVLFRVPDNVERDDERLAGLLRAWPSDLPLTLELQHPTWVADEVHELLREHGAALCATDLDDGPEPGLRRTGSHVYLRLRRTAYPDVDLARWAERLRPFLEDGSDCYAFLRHDDSGESALRAEQLTRLLTPSRAMPPARP